MSVSNYGFTIKCIRKGYENRKAELLIVATEMIRRFCGVLKDYTYEYDSKGRYHIHGYFIARKGIKYNLFKKPYWHIHIDHLRSQLDLETWCSYIHKDEKVLGDDEYCFIKDLNE